MFTIYHNPRCSKSRQTLELLRSNHIEPEVVLYMETPPSKQELMSLLAMLDKSPRDLLRKSEEEYKSLGLEKTSLSDETMIEAMVRHPNLIERPVVVSGKRAVLGRPPENVLELIP
jgi:arsenate reductase